MQLRFRKELYLTSSLVCLAALAIPAAAFAQAAAPAQPANKGIEEIVVTANKRQESINKVGMTIQALSSATLKQQNVATLADLAKAVPGLTFTPSDDGAPVYTLRGVGFYETSLAAYPDVSVYLDQAPLPFPAETELTLFDIQRVEVLEGPQGTLFGNNATGGAINYIANKPTDHFDAGADISYGNYNTLQADGFVSGPLTPKLLGRFAFSATEGDGWQHSMTRNDVSGKQDKAAVRMILDWTPTDDLHIEWNVNGWHDGSQPQQPQLEKFVPNFPTPTPPPDAVSKIAPNDATASDWPAAYEPRADDSLFQSTLRADYDLTDTIKLTSITDFVHYQRNERTDSNGNPFLDGLLSSVTGYANDFSQELRVAGGGAGPLRWIGGLNYSYDTVWERDTGTYIDSSAGFLFGGPLVGADYDSRQNMENYAVFANGEYDIFHQFTLKGGVRFTQADRSDNACPDYSRGNTNLDYPSATLNYLAFVGSELGGYPFAAPAVDQCVILAPATSAHPFAITRYDNHLNQNNVSYHAGIDWKPTNNFLGYVNVSRGYKAGSFPAITGSIFASQEPVTQESVTDYELGVKTQLFHHHLSVNAAGFYYDYTDKQLKSRLIDPLFNVLDALVNIPQSSIRGAEMEIHGRPITGLDIGGAATYLDASIDSFTGVNEAGLVQNFQGEAMPYTPRWQLAGNINYQHPVNDHVIGFAGAQVNYRSGITTAIGSPQDYGIAGYTTLDLQAGIETPDEKWRVFLWGKNVTNQFYVTNIVRSQDGIVRFTGMPATYGITVSYRY